MRFGSLFAGIGGLDLGLERAGMECAWQVEIDDYCRKVLTKHWPDVPKFGDIKECGAHNLEKVDLICGGFPCQDISIAGEGAGIDGEKSGLWSEYKRTICELEPDIVLVENVSALLVRGIERVLSDLAEIGYHAVWDCIPAVAAGAPHRRDRVFIIAYTSSKGLPRYFWEWDSLPVTDEAPSAKFGDRIVSCGPNWPSLAEYLRVGDGVSRGVDQLRGLGNAVVPQVAEYMGSVIMGMDRP